MSGLSVPFVRWPGGISASLRRSVWLFWTLSLASGLLRPALGMPQRASFQDTVEQSTGAKPSISKARSALKAGRLGEARSLYAALLKGRLSSGKRAEALYWVGLLGLAPEMDAQDSGEAQSALAELERSYPGWDRAREAGIVLALARQSAAVRRSLETQSTDATRALELCRSEQEDIGARVESATREAEGLKSALEACRTQEQGLREEVHRKDQILKDKDEALKKVKEVLVDWKAPR